MKNALKQEVAPEPPSVNDKSQTRTQQPVALRGQQLTTTVIGGERPQQQLIQVSEGDGHRRTFIWHVAMYFCPHRLKRRLLL